MRYIFLTKLSDHQTLSTCSLFSGTKKSTYPFNHRLQKVNGLLAYARPRCEPKSDRSRESPKITNKASKRHVYDTMTDFCFLPIQNECLYDAHFSKKHKKTSKTAPLRVCVTGRAHAENMREEASTSPHYSPLLCPRESPYLSC